MLFECIGDKDTIVSMVLLDFNAMRGGEALESLLGNDSSTSTERNLKMHRNETRNESAGMIFEDSTTRQLLGFFFFQMSKEYDPFPSRRTGQY